MITLTKENITDYLKSKMPDLDFSKPLIISEIGEGTAEDDGDGYVNFVFRVSDGNLKLILKQARKEGRGGNFNDLPVKNHTDGAVFFAAADKCVAGKEPGSFLGCGVGAEVVVVGS